jgi:type II secretory pathway pseudopilin PulG
MSGLGDEAGFTLVELLVGIVMSLIIFSAGLTLLDTFQRENQLDEQRSVVQDSARTTIDRMTRQLRNVAAESPTSEGALERSGPRDVVFQTVQANGTPYGGANATNQMRVRYCLDSSNASNATLYMQTQTWTSAVGPSVPSDGGACPSSAWPTRTVVVTNVTNDINGQSRPVFTYAPLGSTAPAQINFVDVDLFLDLNPGKRPGETEMKSGIFLRNSFAAPVASFSVDQSTAEVKLDASASSDPNGQALTFQWSLNGTVVTTATGPQWDAGPRDSTTFPAGSSQTFALTVTSTGGLSATSSQTVTIQ